MIFIHRTPKQKLKMNMDHPLILEYFHAHSKDCAKELKVKAKAPLTEFLTTIKKIIKEVKEDENAESLSYQLMHMRDILGTCARVAVIAHVRVIILIFFNPSQNAGKLLV